MLDYFKTAKFFLMVSLIGVGLVVTSTLFPFIVGKYVWFRSAIGLAALAFAFGLFFHSESEIVWRRFLKIFRNPLVIAVSVFTVVFLLACLFGVNPANSFWSNFERGEGGLQILCLYVFFILAVTLFREEKDWRRLLIFAVAGGLLVVLYGLGAGLKMGGFVGPALSEKGLRFYGSIGNPAYIATYLIFIIAYCLYLLFAEKSRIFKAREIWLSCLSFFFFVFFMLSNTRGAFIGSFAALLSGFVFLGFSLKKWRKRFLITAGIFLFLLIALIFFRNSDFVQGLPFARLFDLSIFTQTFQHRVIMWQIAVKGWTERPLLGWGPENYLNIFDRHFDPIYYVPGQPIGAWFDRAHSVYFDYLAETGILGLLSYLDIFLVYYWQLFKKAVIRKKEEIAGNHGDRMPIFVQVWLFALPIAYLVQGLVLFEVLSIYQQLFLLLAFAAYKLNPPALPNNKKTK